MSAADYRILSEYTGKMLLRALEIFNDGSATTPAPTSADEARLITDGTGNSIASELEDALSALESAAGSKAVPSTVVNVTAASGSWSSATPPTQTIQVTGVTASNNIVVGIASTATAAQLEAASAGKILCTAQGSGTITLTALGDKPTENIPISVMIVG